MLTNYCYRSFYLGLLLISTTSWASFGDRWKTSKVTYNRDSSVTYFKPKASNGYKYFPIRFDTDRDFDLACKLMGHDLSLREPGLNKFYSNDKYKLMFNKDGTLEDRPMKEGNAILKMTCYQKEKIKSSVHAKVEKNDDGTYSYSNIYFLRGDMGFYIAYDETVSETENYNRVCRLLDKRTNVESEDVSSFALSIRGLRAFIDNAPKFTHVEKARYFIAKVTCSAEQLPVGKK
jgi:hypothetical protein